MMKSRTRIAIGFAAAAVLLGGAGSVAAAHPINPPNHGPAVAPANGPVDQPEPGDTPDQPGAPDEQEPGEAPDNTSAPDQQEPGEAPDAPGGTGQTPGR